MFSFQMLIVRLCLLVLMCCLTACGQALQLATPTVSVGLGSTQVAAQTEVPTLAAAASTVAETPAVSGTPVLETPTVVLTATELLTMTQGAGGVVTVVPVPVDGAPVVVPTFGASVGGGPWSAQQSQREDFAAERLYSARSPVSLLWYDPVTGQDLEIGRIVGQFRVSAQFLLKSSGDAQAFAVPYTIDQDYSLTAISPAIIDRMRSAGAQDSVEAYVLADDAIVPVATSNSVPRVPALSHVLASSKQVGTVDL